MTTPQLAITTPHAFEREQAANRHSALEWAQTSVVGARGGVNQDAVLVQPPHFFGVADGVGGGSYGEVASATTLRHCANAPEISGTELSAWVRQSDRVVADAISQLSDRLGGATLVALWLRGMRGSLLHVGDARACLFRRTWRGRWAQIWQSLDQTYANCEESPPPGGSPDDPCRMIGTSAVGEPGQYDFQMKEDDFLLLCTDGLHRFVPEAVILRILDNGARSGRSIKEIAVELVGKAQRNGSHDDITVLLLHRKRPSWRIWALVVTALLLAASTALNYLMNK
jgi:protein phosphatase